MRISVLVLGLVSVCGFGAGEALGQSVPGVSDKEIVIGSCAALQGPSKMLGSQTVAGAQAYFSLINAQGGVNGRKLRLVSYDDSYDPAKAQECFDKLREDKVFALGFFVGTPTAVKYVPMAESAKIPLVGLFAGAQTLYSPMRHWVVNVRASYATEMQEQMAGVWDKLSYQRVGVIYPDDAFGASVLEGLKEALKARGGEPVAAAAYKRQTDDVRPAIDAVKAASPQAVVVVGPPNTVAPILRESHAAGWKPLFLTVSFVGTEELIRMAGNDSDGVVITQVVPPYYLTGFKTVALYRRALGEYAPHEMPNFVSLEGFVDAMVMVEGLNRAGKDLTREGLIRGIESMHDVDLGLGPQMKADYSAKSHKGFEHVIPTVIRGGRAVPFTDWQMVAAK